MNVPAGPLFRAEVVESRRARIEGEIILTEAPGHRFLVLLLFGFLLVGAVAVAFGSYSRTEAAPGILVTAEPSAKINVTRPGQVAELLVQEGAFVRAGQRLAVIRTEQKDAAGASVIDDGLSALEAQRRLSEEQVRLAGSRASTEKVRLNAVLGGFRQQRADLRSQIDLQEQAVASAKDMVERVESLLVNGFISRIEVERRRQAYISAQQELGRLRQQSNALQSEIARTTAELSGVAAQAGSEIASARTSSETIVQQQAHLRGERSYSVVAPIAGHVTALQAGVGRTVDSSIPLMEIIPAGTSLKAHIFAPTRAIGFVKPDQEVRLLYDAFPYQRFGSFSGRIVGVSRTVIDPRQIAVPLKIEEPVYRIEILPAAQGVAAFGEQRALQPGMTLTANIVLDRRSFLDWLLTPLDAVMRRDR